MPGMKIAATGGGSRLKEKMFIIVSHQAFQIDRTIHVTLYIEETGKKQHTFPDGIIFLNIISDNMIEIYVSRRSQLVLSNSPDLKQRIWNTAYKTYTRILT